MYFRLRDYYYSVGIRLRFISDKSPSSPIKQVGQPVISDGRDPFKRTNVINLNSLVLSVNINVVNVKSISHRKAVNNKNKTFRTS